MPRHPFVRLALVVVLAVGSSPAPGASATRVAPEHELCGGCHRPATPAEASRRAARVTLAAAPRDGGATPSDVVACEECHAAQTMPDPVRFGARRHAGLACLSCHDAHPNGIERQFRRERVDASGASAAFDSETRLCVSCHFGLGQFRGVGGGFVQHPVGIPAPRHDGHVVPSTMSGARVAPAGNVVLPLASIARDGGTRDVIGCATCHELHGNSNTFQLRWNHTQEYTACASCHEESVGVPGTAASAATSTSVR